jgi:hypothetical protein
MTCFSHLRPQQIRDAGTSSGFPETRLDALVTKNCGGFSQV